MTFTKNMVMLKIYYFSHRPAYRLDIQGYLQIHLICSVFDFKVFLILVKINDIHI